MDPRELIQKANEAKKKADDIRAEHFKDGKWGSVEAKANYDTAIDDAFKAKDVADEAVQQAERDAKAREIDTWLERSAGLLPGMSGGGAKSDDDPGEDGRLRAVQFKSFRGKSEEVKQFTPTGGRRFKAEDEVSYTSVFRRYLMDGRVAMADGDRRLAEAKALSVGLDAAGGHLVVSEVFLTELLQSLEDAVVMRRLGRVLPPLAAGSSMGVRAASDLDDAEWTTELGTGSQDTATPFLARRLSPHPLAKKVLVSDTLIRASEINAEAWVREEGGNRFSAAEENAFMTGSGAGQPEGVFTSSLPTVVTAVSATDIDYPDLVETEFSLKAQYRPQASWIMHRTIIKELMLLVDGTGRPLLRDMPGAGVRFSLFGYDINESEYAPSASTTGQKVAGLGNWARAYWIVDSLALRVKRLDELYAEDDQIGFHFRKETDGMVVQGDGISILKMA